MDIARKKEEICFYARSADFLGADTLNVAFKLNRQTHQKIFFSSDDVQERSSVTMMRPDMLERGSRAGLGKDVAQQWETEPDAGITKFNVEIL